MNLRDLKYIIEVANYKNFTKAAEASNVSQPALTMQIKKLEDSLGIKIFERDNHEFLVTKVGEDIIRKSQEILKIVDDIKKSAKNSHDIYAGEFKIGAFPTLATYYFPKIIPKISKHFPKLKLFLIEEKTESLLAKLKNGEIDCAFLAMPIINHDLKHRKIFEEPFYLAVSKHNKLAKKKIILKKDLQKQSLMLLEDGHCLRNQALEICSTMNAFESSDFKASSLETLRQMVAIDAGITLMPQIAAIKNNKISYLKIKPQPTREIGLYWRKEYYRAELTKEIARMICEISL